MSENNTINLDDSSVLSSTKNSSVLEISEDSVVDVEDSASSDTEGEDEPSVNSTSENVDSSSDRLIRENSKDLSTAELVSEDEMVDQSQSQTREHYVTSQQSLASLADQSSVSSATFLLSDSSSHQATKDESSILEDLTRELAGHKLKLSESVVEGLGIQEVDSSVEDLTNKLANKIKILNDLKNDAGTLGVTNDNTDSTEGTDETVDKVIEETLDKVIEETFKDKSIAKSFGENVAAENDSIIAGNLTEPTSPHKRKVDKEDLGSGEIGDVEDNLTLNGSELLELPAKRQRVVDPALPSTCQVLTSARSGAKVYLVGTAHFSKESCEDVRRVIEATQPDIVMLELCKARTNILHMDEEAMLEEAKNLNLERSLEILKSQGMVQGVLYLLLLSLSAHLTEQLGMAPGGEFRTAFAEAKKVPGCIIQLGDRPINITMKRAIASLSIWQRVKLAWNLLSNKDPITKEEVEKCKDRDLLESMLLEMAGEFPALSSVFVGERDIFLTHSLQMAADSIPPQSLGPKGQLLQSASPTTVVGVVGIGHTAGIAAHWGRISQDQVRAVVQVEPPSAASRLFSFTVRTAMWAGCLYGAYRVLRGPVERILIVK